MHHAGDRPWRDGLMEMARRPKGGVEVLVSDTDGEGGREESEPNPHSSYISNPHRSIDRLAPWVYYVPIQNNYSDLYDAIVFFCGDLAGRGTHEELAAKITREARE
ncbi:hypothetical protein AZE42_09463 [Rhizopogon vesiculosus]|uniref:Uncharacterized protein n=1 Tax=Rhizopogon vesiculosus TaxID=180088 RepID=A0A1J8R8F2_9AGAM|nr:hypothetical protein AZE42_09463 [Rhizopogon vesiculosus]